MLFQNIPGLYRIYMSRWRTATPNEHFFEPMIHNEDSIPGAVHDPSSKALSSSPHKHYASSAQSWWSLWFTTSSNILRASLKKSKRMHKRGYHPFCIKGGCMDGYGDSALYRQLNSLWTSSKAVCRPLTTTARIG